MGTEGMRCRICKNVEGNIIYQVKERRLNEGEAFPYLYCGRCGTLQLNERIKDIGKYYREDYYSFHLGLKRQNAIKKAVKQAVLSLIARRRLKLPFLMEDILREKMGWLMILYKTGVRKESRILDVGGGNGKWLADLSQYGFRHLTCVDLYCEKSPFDAVRFKQGDILGLDDKELYDLITFNHSFEHMEEPGLILQKVKKLLSADGLCLIRIPVNEGDAWDRYKENWFQIDAPRHFYLYTERALGECCRKYGLQIVETVFDSGPRQFLCSEYYEKTDMSLDEIEEKITAWEKNAFRRVRRRLNRTGRGDQATFYIKHE